MLPAWLQKLIAMFRRHRIDAELDEEIRIHLEMAAEDYVRAGLTRREARLAARRSFGGVDQVKEHHRDVRGFRWLEELVRDLRFAVRTLAKARGFATVVILTLAVGLGASAAILSVVDGVLVRPLGYADEGRIVRIRAGAQPAVRRDDQGALFSEAGYWHFANKNRVFEAFGGVDPRPVPVPLTGDGPPLQLNVIQQTASMFELLGVMPLLGRLYTRAEDVPGGPAVVLLSAHVWRSRFGSDPSIVGRALDLNGTHFEVVGVMPPQYAFPSPETDVWVPLQLDPASTRFGVHYIDIFGKLAPGETVATATADAEGLIGRFGEVGYGPEWFANAFDGTAVVKPIKETVVGSSRRPLLILLGSVGLLVLIAFSNIANLLLVRAEGRAREYAIRRTLGSGHRRLMQQSMTEGVLLAVVGGAFGIALALGAVRFLVSLAPASIPRLDEIGISGPVLALTAIVAVCVGLVLGILPSLHKLPERPFAALGDGGHGVSVARSRLRVRNTLVVSQVALALVLLVGSGLLVRSFQRLQDVDPGFRTDGVLTFGLRPSPAKYDAPEDVVQFYDHLLGELELIPGVSAAGGIVTLPMTESGTFAERIVEGFPVEQGEIGPVFYLRRVTPGYFEAMGIPVLEGRVFGPDDHNLPLATVVVSNSVKRRFWPETSPIGKRISGSTIVGVVGDVHGRSLDTPIEDFVYYPMLDSTGSGVSAMKMVVRSQGDPLAVLPAVRDLIGRLDPDLPIAEVRPMSEILGDSMNRTSFTMTMIVLATIIATFLACVGIYGVISYSLSQRKAEIGMRLALGALPSQVFGIVALRGMKLAGAGVALGLIAAIALSGILSTLLFGVDRLDAVTLVGGPLLLLGVACLASVVPAWKAARTAPSVAFCGR
jgi:predicted permease